MTLLKETEPMTTIRQLSSIRIDFDSPEEVTGYATLLCRLASEAGLFLSGGGAAAEKSAVRQAAKEWLRQIDRRIDSMTAADAFNAVCSYDIIHRLAYQTPAYPDVVNRHVLRAFDALVHGDRQIDRYALFRQITAGLNRRDPAYFGRLLQWQSLCLDRWHKEFRRLLVARRPIAASADIAGSAALSGMSVYDLIQRATLLLESDLYVFETGNESAFKRSVFDMVRPCLDRPGTYDPRTLRALGYLITAAQRLGYLTPEAADGLRAAIALTPDNQSATRQPRQANAIRSSQVSALRPTS